MIDPDSLRAFRMPRRARWHALNPVVSKSFCGTADPARAQSHSTWTRVVPDRCQACERSLGAVLRRSGVLGY